MNSDTGKEQREIRSVAQGKARMCQVVTMIFPCFSLKLLEVHMKDEERSVLFIRWVFSVLHRVCVCSKWLHTCCMKKSPVMLLFNTHQIYFFTD